MICRISSHAIQALSVKGHQVLKMAGKNCAILRIRQIIQGAVACGTGCAQLEQKGWDLAYALGPLALFHERLHQHFCVLPSICLLQGKGEVY
jgi:hypothetical protein